MKLKSGIFTVFTAVLLMAEGCIDTDNFESRLDDLDARISKMEDAVRDVNSNAVAIHALLNEKTVIVGKTEITKDGTVIGYTIDFSSGDKINVTFGDRYDGSVPVVGIDDEGYWTVSTDNGETFVRMNGNIKASYDGCTPSFRIDNDGFWTYSYNGIDYMRMLDGNGNPISIDGNKMSGGSPFREVSYDESTGTMTFVLQQGGTYKVPVINTFFVRINVTETNRVITIGETKLYEAQLGDVQNVAIKAPEGWSATLDEDTFTVTAPSAAMTEGEYSFTLYATSDNNYFLTETVTLLFKPINLDASACTAWNNFISGNEANVLLDYSYAGYNHGESAPADVYSLGYTVYDITKYGAVPNDGLSDREAFLAAVKDALKKDYEIKGNNITFAPNENARAIIYFPEGEFILHTTEDDVDGQSQSILIRGSKFVLKGAGMDKTRIVMEAPNQPTDPNVMYSSPDMIQLKHNSTFSSLTPAATVTGSASKGGFSVQVASTAGIKEGDWVCLHVLNSDADFVSEELAPYDKDDSWDISKKGVEVIDYHQIKKIESNTVTFYEPIMHPVNPERGWEIKKYPNYTEIGVEDITFAGKAKDDFKHHGSWEDDGAYKPLSMTRLTNSWIRRVRFESTSEACSIINCSNVSAYSIEFTGNRGHASVRSQASSRVFIGATNDMTSGYLVGKGNMISDTYDSNTGNYHAVGVSKQSIGAVLWRNKWGDDSCFESHATQPRATLIDHCEGGWMRWRQGGDASQVPNHLADLTVWNFNMTSGDKLEQDGDINSNFIWWDNSSPWWKILPPVIVGFHGIPVTFNGEQTKYIESNGQETYPQSLYEAQLKKRLGFVPAWLESLK